MISKSGFMLSIVVLFLLFAIVPVVKAQTPNPQELLTQYISDLQKNPNDNALREKIIKHVQTMKPAPVMPEEAERSFVKGVTFLKEAKDAVDFDLAVAAFRQALLIAPWWSDAYYNLGIALGAATQYDDAIKTINFYITATQPSEADAQRAKRKIWDLEAKKELAAKGKAQKETNEKEEQAAKLEKERLNSFEGKWRVTYSEKQGESRDTYVGDTVTITKKDNIYTVDGPDWFFQTANFTLSGRMLSGMVTPSFDDLKDIFTNTPDSVLRQADSKIPFRCSLTLSSDGRTINAEHDNYRIQYSKTSGFIGYDYNFQSTERVQGGFKVTLTRIDEKIEGIGILLTIEKGEFTVVRVIEDSPACKSGVEAEDKITKVNGIDVRNMEPLNFVEKIRGPKGTSVTITIFREGWQVPMDFTIVRDAIKVDQ